MPALEVAAEVPGVRPCTPRAKPAAADPATQCQRARRASEQRAAELLCKLCMDERFYTFGIWT